MSVRLRLMGWVVAAGLTLTLTVSGCGSSTSATPSTTTALPTGPALLATSAAAMKAVTSAHFTLTVTGKIPDLTVQAADGDLTSTGDAKGSAKIIEFGQLVQVEFVVTAKDLYLKGPTGGFTKLPAALAGQVYDPTSILNADKGVSKVLSSVVGPAAPSSSGSSYVVTGTVPKAVAASLVPGIAADVAGTFTIDQATSQVTHITLGLTGSDSKPAAVDFVLTDFNKTVAVSAPA